jgi:hypothetical protein
MAYKHAYWGYKPYILSSVLGKDSSQILSIFFSVSNDIKSVILIVIQWNLKKVPTPSITITSHWYKGSKPTYTIHNDFWHKPFILSATF